VTASRPFCGEPIISEGFEEKSEFVPGGFSVVTMSGVDGHYGGQTQYRRVGRARKGADGSPQRYRKGRRRLATESQRAQRGERSEDRPTQSQRGKARKGTDDCTEAQSHRERTNQKASTSFIAWKSPEFDYTAERKIFRGAFMAKNQCRKETETARCLSSEMLYQGPF